LSARVSARHNKYSITARLSQDPVTLTLYKKYERKCAQGSFVGS